MTLIASFGADVKRIFGKLNSAWLSTRAPGLRSVLAGSRDSAQVVEKQEPILPLLLSVSSILRARATVYTMSERQNQ